MSENTWQFRGDDHWTPTPEFLEMAGGSPLLARLLYNRGLQTVETARQFLELDKYPPTSGLELPDMAQGVERIIRAIDQKENILIFGDFDVDGITGTSILYEALKTLDAKVSYYIPDRAKEGHGLNVAALCRLVSTRQLKLVITTDTGVSNFNEISLLKGLGVDTVVTDHHELPENLPPSIANINPKLLEDQEHPLALLCGAGVAFKLCELLYESYKMPPELTEKLLDLVAIGTVADLVPLHAENRYLVYRGIQVLNKRQRLGVNEILTQANAKFENPRPDVQLTSETIGFTIGPRLNALGRLDNASDAVELLTTDDTEKAKNIAAHLEHLNRRRQELCDKTFIEAEKFLVMTGGLDGRKAIILGSPDWNPGIIGIVASRLIEKYHVPVFMMVIDESKGEARASARSIPGFNLHDALVPLAKYLIHFGGHSGAAGFALKMDQMDAFKRELYALADRTITEEQMRPRIEVDTKVQWSQLNPFLIDLIAKLAPYGKDNPSPTFVLENASIGAQRLLGAEGKHLKLILHGNNPKEPVEGLIWNVGGKEKLNPMSPYHFVVSPELNTFNNVSKVQLIIQDFKSADKSDSARIQHVSQAEPLPIPAMPAAPTAPKIPVGAMASTSSRISAVEDEEEDDKNRVNWIDHRSREGIDSFVGQLMLPLQDGREVILYHEGRKPQIPFLSESILCNRYNLRKAQELILWDLPPDLRTFQAILRQVEPLVIHMIGGKFQSVPVFPVVKDYLKVIFQILSKTEGMQEGQPAPVSLDQLASQLSTTRMVMMQGLILLSRTGLISVSIPEASPEQVKNMTVMVQLLPANARQTETDLSQTLEWAVFQQVLTEVGRFRDWLLSVPLDTIKTSVTLVPDPDSSREETTSYGKSSGSDAPRSFTQPG